MKMTYWRSVLLALLTLAVTSSACGRATPTTMVSPVETDTFASPLDEPTAPATEALTEQATKRPTSTPDAERTPVAIVDAEIKPDREVITIKNVSDVEQDVSKWTLFNLNREPLFLFPDSLTLQPGESIEIYSAVPEEDVPEGALFWTEERIWREFPAHVVLLNQAMRVVYSHVENREQ